MSGAAATVRRPVLGPQAQEALALVIACVQEGLTGTLQIEFRNGVPQLSRRTETRRLGSNIGQHTLTVAR